MSEKEQVKTQPVPVQPVLTRNEITARQFIWEQPEFPQNLRKTVTKELLLSVGKTGTREQYQAAYKNYKGREV